jgi:hypothetical protein
MVIVEIIGRLFREMELRQRMPVDIWQTMEIICLNIVQAKVLHCMITRSNVARLLRARGIEIRYCASAKTQTQRLLFQGKSACPYSMPIDCKVSTQVDHPRACSSTECNGSFIGAQRLLEMPNSFRYRAQHVPRFRIIE